MTRGTTRLIAAVVALALLGAPAAFARGRQMVELERDSCAGPVAAVMSGENGVAVFHNLDAGRYVVTLPAEAGRVSVAVADDGGRWISGRLSAVTDGRRYAVGRDGERIVVAVARGGAISVQLDGL